MVNGGVRTIVCHYCGYRSDSMTEAARHDAERPESCVLWRRVRKLAPLSYAETHIWETLRHLSVQGGDNLDRQLDRDYERLQRVYR
jgi:hypothetical protein